MSDTQSNATENKTDNVVQELRELLALAEAGEVRSLGVITIEKGPDDADGQFTRMRSSFTSDGASPRDLVNLVMGSNRLQSTILGELRDFGGNQGS